MDPIKIREDLAAAFEDFARNVARPCGCERCGAARALWWNGFGVRSAAGAAGSPPLPDVRAQSGSDAVDQPLFDDGAVRALFDAAARNQRRVAAQDGHDAILDRGRP
jgi:hypothetical protein